MIIENSKRLKFDTTLGDIQAGSVLKMPELGNYFMKTDDMQMGSVVIVDIENGHTLDCLPSTRVCQIHAKVVIL